MLMKQITNRLIEIGYLNAGSNFRNAAFEKERRINIYFQKRSMSGILLLLPLKKLKKGWPKDFRCSVKSCWIRVFFSPKHRLGRCQGSEQTFQMFGISQLPAVFELFII